MEPFTVVLSVLICHLSSRAIFKTLLEKLQKQSEGKPVEILIEEDNGEKSIGEKRNLLMRQARGIYIVYVDDDDDVSDDYIDVILRAAERRPDCIGMEGMLCTPEKNYHFKHSIQFQGWYTGVDAFYRTPNHLNPVKRSIAEGVFFPEVSRGEDHTYSDFLRMKLKTEEYIDHPIYFYRKDYSKCGSSQ